MTFPLVPLSPDVVALWPGLVGIHVFLGNEMAAIAIVAGSVLLMIAVVMYWNTQTIAQMDLWQKWVRLFLGIILFGVVSLVMGAIVVVPLFLGCAVVALIGGIRIAF